MIIMGHKATVTDIRMKLQTRYGSVLSVEALTEKLYALKQGNEDGSSSAFNIEEIVYQMEEKGGIAHDAVEEKVKLRFWYGLNDSRVKEATRAQHFSLSSDKQDL